MKIAVLSDIHGNSVALAATLREVKRLKIKTLLVLGDMVGYYYRADEVLTALEEFNTVFIRGNHEDMLRQLRDDPTSGTAIHNKYGHALDVTLEKVSPEKITWLITLPATRTSVHAGVSFKLCHGAPWQHDAYIYPDAPVEVLQRAADADEDFVLIGNTHYPLLYTQGKAIVVNPGSVGQARDSGGAASWAIIDTQDKSVTFERTPYDISLVIKDCERYDSAMPYLQEVLRRQKA